jgi:hypothetical protein
MANNLAICIRIVEQTLILLRRCRPWAFSSQTATPQALTGNEGSIVHNYP